MTQGFDIDELERLLAIVDSYTIDESEKEKAYEIVGRKVSACRDQIANEIRELRAENARLKGDGGFLLERLGDLEWHDGAFEQTAREYFGHVEPAIERFRAALGEPQ